MTCQGETTWQEQVRVAPTALPRKEVESNVSLLTADLVFSLPRCTRKEPRVRHTHTHTHTHARTDTNTHTHTQTKPSEDVRHEKPGRNTCTTLLYMKKDTKTSGEERRCPRNWLSLYISKTKENVYFTTKGSTFFESPL